MQVLQFEDPQLIRLAEALPQTVLQARAKGTTDKYTDAGRYGQRESTQAGGFQ